MEAIYRLINWHLPTVDNNINIPSCQCCYLFLYIIVAIVFTSKEIKPTNNDIFPLETIALTFNIFNPFKISLVYQVKLNLINSTTSDMRSKISFSMKCLGTESIGFSCEQTSKPVLNDPEIETDDTNNGREQFCPRVNMSLSFNYIFSFVSRYTFTHQRWGLIENRETQIIFPGGGHFHINLYVTCRFSGYHFSA